MVRPGIKPKVCGIEDRKQSFLLHDCRNLFPLFFRGVTSRWVVSTSVKDNGCPRRSRSQSLDVTFEVECTSFIVWELGDIEAHRAEQQFMVRPCWLSNDNFRDPRLRFLQGHSGEEQGTRS